MSKADIEKLTKKERIVLMEELWDSLDDDSDELNSPAWHEDVLKKRVLDSGVKTISIDELKKR